MLRFSSRTLGFFVLAIFSLSACKVLNGSTASTAASEPAAAPASTGGGGTGGGGGGGGGGTPSSDATLSTIALSSGSVSPAFDPTVTSYTASVSGTTTSITITPSAGSGTATIQVRVNSGSWSTVTSGAASGALTMNSGVNKIEVLVTAADGTTKTYTIDVTRNADSTPPILSIGTLTLTAYPTTVSISWTGASDETTSGPSLQYKVVQASATTELDTIAEANADTVTIVKDWTANISSASATGLSSSTTYAFAVLVRDAAGNMTLYTPNSIATLAADSTPPSLSSAVLSHSETQNSVTLSWTAATDSGTPQALIQYQVYQGIDAANLATTTTINDSIALEDGNVTALSDWTNGMITYTVSGLKPSTTYYFNVIAQDQAATPNQAIYSAVTVTTSADSNPPTPAGSIGVSGGVTFASVSWSAASDDVSLASALEYKLVMADTTAEIDSLAEINAGNGSVVMNFSPGVTAASVGGLVAGSTHAFAVVVRDEAGNEALYSPQSVALLSSDSSAPSPGAAITLTSHTGTIDISWGAATDNGTPQNNLLYRVFMTTGAASTIDTVAEALAATALTDWTIGMTSVTAEDLVQGTTYAFAVLVKDGAGNTAIYSPTTGSLLSDTTSPTIGATFSATPYATSVDLAWAAGTDNITNATKLRYKVVQDTSSTAIDTVAEADASANIVVDWTENLTSATAGDLLKATSYSFAVLVKDEAGNKSLYGPRTVTTTNPTDATAPTVGNSGALTTLAGVDANGVPYVTVSWTKASDSVTTSGNLQYQLVSSSLESNIDSVSKALTAKVEKSWFTSSSTTISANASNLSAGTLYAFNVIVKDQAGNMSVYVPASETTDFSGVPGAVVMKDSDLPSGETWATLGLRSFNGQKSGFYFQLGGETQAYYYQYLAGKTSAGYNHYLVKFSSSGVAQTSFGPNSTGWLNLRGLTGVPNYANSNAVFHWQVCNGGVYVLGYVGSNTYKVYKVTLTGSDASFGSDLVGGTGISSSTANMKDFSCLGSNLYVSFLYSGNGGDKNKPMIFKYDTVAGSGTTSSAFTATNYFAPFADGSGNLWFYNAVAPSSGTPAFNRLNLTNSTIVSTSSVSTANFPDVTYNGTTTKYGFFGGFQETDLVMYSALNSAVRIWSDTADNQLTNLAAGAVTPTVSYTSSIVKALSSGTITDGRLCRVATKYLGYGYYKYLSKTTKGTKTYYGYSLYLSNPDGSRSSFLNNGNEITFRNKTYGYSAGSASKKYISLACDDTLDQMVAAFRVSKGNVALIFRGIDANLP